MADPLSSWERLASEPARPGVPTHRRGHTLAAEPPAARLVELTQTLEQTRQALAAACGEVRRLSAENDDRGDDDDVWHSFRVSSFGGVPMAQYLVDLYVWEAVLNEHRDVRAILEIGTWLGGFSWWLWAQTQARGMRGGFCTWDAVAPSDPPPEFERLDVFANPGEVVAAMGAALGPVLLFCDGGNKPRELRTFAPELRAGDVIAVHDWGTEMPPGDVPDCLVMVHGEFCERLGSITRFFEARG